MYTKMFVFFPVMAKLNFQQQSYNDLKLSYYWCSISNNGSYYYSLEYLIYNVERFLLLNIFVENLDICDPGPQNQS